MNRNTTVYAIAETLAKLKPSQYRDWQDESSNSAITAEYEQWEMTVKAIAEVVHQNEFIDEKDFYQGCNYTP